VKAKSFTDRQEAILAYNNKYVHIQAKIKVRIDGEIVETSVGRLIFNKVIPEEMGYRNESFDKKNCRLWFAKPIAYLDLTALQS
jgi:DNA-directed RNA polymerase subunit beta'